MSSAPVLGLFSPDPDTVTVTLPQPPPYADLTYHQRTGWACCWCGTSLLRAGGVPAGRARGRSGTHVLDVDVYACGVTCPKVPTSAGGHQ